MIEIIWLDCDQVIKHHSEQIRRYGGQSGIRDQGLLDSALMRPRNLFYYENIDNLPILAATYASAIVKNHPFFDGNKRTGFASATIFLLVNNFELNAPHQEIIDTFLKIADNKIDKKQLYY
ncbi:MAG: type II toxin-antitoxin system death-on-curing family toxin [Microcystaceae cyanobacterium]